MTTTLTREAFLDRAKPSFQWVDIPKVGRVGIRSCPEIQRSRRIASMFDSAGRLADNSKHLRRIYQIVDQLMSDEDTPMFTEKDVKVLGELDASKLDPFIAAIQRFNEELEKNEETGSSDTSESLEATTV